MAEPIQRTPEIKLEQRPATVEVVPADPSSLSIDHRPVEPSPGVPGPDIPKDALQEADAAQILTLADSKFWEARRRGVESGPPRRGDRKTARAANGRGLSYFQAGEIREAVSAFWDAHQADPADVEVLNNLGHAYLMQGDLASAELYILAALAVAPQRAAAWSDLGQVYGKNGDTMGAVSAFANAYRFSQNRDKTHQFFLGLLEKQEDASLKQALQQITRIAEQQLLTTTQ
ncbi:MAG: tetratricopeptide repeat protein [bacterium]